MNKKLWFIVCLIVAVLILAHQYLVFGYWFELADIHHETLALVVLAFGAGLVI
jgi:hypothetical protein